MHDYKLLGTNIKLFHICGKMDSSMYIVRCRPYSFEHESQYLILVNVTLKYAIHRYFDISNTSIPWRSALKDR